MTITINGERLTIKSAKLVEILQNFGAKTPFAVAINGEFIPQSLHASTTINEGDSIELLSPIQGG
ncbi:thiamine biosynthesis protein ThiS [Pseudoalteromonas sp. MM1]|uniref:sulfur carrier protein ThiS n=1 Tax=Pseudoalteromonas sp. MM1 TaxID=3036714 RepID=UPI002572ABA2|nr:sulfur carrier protein ThiS [Pseudoalteromonas sp. MM1]BED88029.1 thiamine biosynthesis protein ThiS [Pseudoalteromonas sp. MM1]